MKVFVFDASRCNGCHGCQIACKDEHCGNDWMPISAPQPETGHFWCRVNESVEGQVPKVKMSYDVQMCQHCEDCKLLEAAGDAAYRRADGLVIIDPVKAKGRRDLVETCPYGNVYWNEELSLPQKCTGCAHLVDAGEKPRCADFCQTGGLRWGELDEFVDELEAAGVFDPATKDTQRFYRINMPKLFCAGEVWDPVANEIVEGASITLKGSDGGSRTTTSDDFGDFWFRQIDEGTYDLYISADGFVPVERKAIKVSKSLSLGDFPLEK